ncbi:hypothetical protein ASG67_15830 [Sphingomonas sp. Leaf339]|nr:hypothetical protein ASG67_15830 [Sphingomonas sp. Leaf339]
MRAADLKAEMQHEPLKFKEPHLAFAGMAKIDLIHALDADRSPVMPGLGGGDDLPADAHRNFPI